MGQKIKEFKCDSYVVDVIRPAKTVPFPAIFISRRKKKRRTGELALEPGEFLKVSSHDFDPPNIDETARQIGRAILDDSDIVRDFTRRRF
ncbi:hypothetical protein ES703_101642 [subsurface metagenome]